MLLHQRSPLSVLATIFLLGSLTACANTPWGKSLEDSLSADPQRPDPSVAETPPETASPQPSLSPEEATLPHDFPVEILPYPGAKLETVTPADRPEAPVVTQWVSDDATKDLEGFYQRQFGEKGWQILSQDTQDSKRTLVARRGTLQVEVAIQPHPDRQKGTTALTIEYHSQSGQETAKPQEGETSSPTASESASTANPPLQFGDLDGAATQVRSYIEDLAKLGVLTSGDKAENFNPDAAITRRDYARWLLAANNKIYGSTPSKQIRPATASSKPVFQDLPATDPDFAAIQGLAEAGIVPSRLTGEDTTTQFRPDAPLMREDLVLWKVPLDLRKVLPTATLDALKETWGFQDAAQIEAKALRAVFADFQNGDLSNIRRSLGYTTLFQPKKSVTRAEAAAALWYFGFQGEGRSAKDALKREERP